MSNDKCSVEIDTKAHYLKESAKEDETDYHAKAEELLSDLDTFSELFPDKSESFCFLMRRFYSEMTTQDSAPSKNLKEYIYHLALKHVGGS